jgi:S1-C subfamily serine protease
VSILDVLFVLVLAVSIVGGFRRGAVHQLLGLLGVALGIAAGLAITTAAAGLGQGHVFRLVLIGLVVSCGAAGAISADRLGTRFLAGRVRIAPDSKTDAIAGAGLSAVALLVVLWLVGVNLANGPFPRLASALRDALTVRSMAAVLPAPPPLVPSLERLAEHFGFRAIFVGLPPVPQPPVPIPDPEAVSAASSAGLAGSIEVLGTGCIASKYNEGSGFVIAEGYVMTAAHVLAGTHDPFLYDGKRYPATVVAFDPSMDVAVVYAPSFAGQPLPFSTAEAPRGSGGAIVGFPQGYHPTASAAAVRGVVDVLGRDIYGRGSTRKRLYELQADVTGGDSGGPFVLPTGQVAGMVTAGSVLDEHVSYAIPAHVLEDISRTALGRRDAVPVGSCVLG